MLERLNLIVRVERVEGDVCILESGGGKICTDDTVASRGSFYFSLRSLEN